MQTLTKPSPIPSLVRLELIPPSELDGVWVECEAHVEKATQRSNGRYTPADIKVAVWNGWMQLWVAHDGPQIISVCITEVNKHPGGLELCIVALGGENYQSWANLLPFIEEWGREQGCRWGHVEGRDGIEKILGPTWQRGQRVFEKEL